MPIVKVGEERIKFPDNMSQDQIKAALASRYQQPSPAQVAPPRQIPASVQARFDDIQSNIDTFTAILDRQRPTGYQDPSIAKALELEQAKLAEAQSLYQQDPAMAEIAAETGPLQAAGVGFQAGLRDVGRGAVNLLGGDMQQDPATQRAIKALEGQSSAAQIGRLAGQSAPFLPAGGAAGRINPALVRVPAMGAIGGLEGATIAAGQDKTAEQILLSAGLGFLLAGGTDLAVPYIRSVGRKIIDRVGGSKAAKVVDDAGNITPEFEKVLQENNIDLAEELASRENISTIQSIAQAADRPTQQSLDEVAAIVQPDPARVRAAESLGLTDVPAPVVSASQPVQELGGALAAVPASQASQELDRFASQLGFKVDDLIEELGGKLDAPQASDELLKRMSSRRESLIRQENKLYNFEIPPRTPVNTDVLLDKLESRAADVGGAKNLSPVYRRLLTRLKGDTTYGLIDQERKQIGAAIGARQGVYKDAAKADLDELYADLTDIQKREADRFGFANQWQDAKALTVQRKALEDSTQSLFGQNLTDSAVVKVTRGLKNLQKGDLKDFNQAMRSIPKEERPGIVATALNGVFTTPRGNKQFNASTFSNWWDSINRSSVTKNTLKEALPEGGIDRLESLAQISKGLSGVTSRRTRTGIVKALLDDFDKSNGLAAKLYSFADKADAVPVAGSTVRVASNLAKMAAKDKTPVVESIDNLLNSTQFRKTLYETAANPESRKAKLLQAQLEQTKAYKDFVSKLGRADASAIASTGLIPFLVSDDEQRDL